SRHTAQMHGASAARPDPTAKLGPGQPKVVAQDPEERGIGLNLDGSGPSIHPDAQLHGALRPSKHVSLSSIPYVYELCESRRVDGKQFDLAREFSNEENQLSVGRETR